MRISTLQNKGHSGRPKTIDDSDLQALLEEDDTQTQQITEALNVTLQAISNSLQAVGKNSEGRKMNDA